MPVPVKDRTGEINKSTCGQFMTIIAFHRCDDIDVQFEDGTVVEHVRYGAFKKGYVKNPSLVKTVPIENRVGYKVKNGSGFIAECIHYTSERDTIVKFEDGTVVKCRWGNFIKGVVRNPNQKKAGYKKKEQLIQAKQRIGEKVKAKNGQECELIEYFSERNCTVKFEDETIVKNIRYSHFKDGCVRNPNYRSDNPTWKPYLERLGEENYNNRGDLCKIVEYNSAGDIKVQFETEEIISTTYKNFKLGSINKNTNKTNAEIFIGLEGIVKANSEKMVIVGYRNSKDIDVQFEDGTVIKSTLQVFKQGSCVNPNNLVGRHGGNIRRTDYVGRVRYSKLGQKMEIVKYSTSQDIDVLFDNGVLVEHCRLSSFNKSEIRNPKYGLHKKAYMSCGIEAEIIEWENPNNIKVKFADGLIVDSTWSQFSKGFTQYPTMNMRQVTGEFVGFNVGRAQWCEETNDLIYYECKCKKCSYSDILTPTEMMEHFLKCN